MGDDDVQRKITKNGLTGQALEAQIVRELKIEDADKKSPLEVFKEIVAISEAEGSECADELKSALPLLETVKEDLPKNSCPTVEGIQESVKKHSPGSPK